MLEMRVGFVRFIVSNPLSIAGGESDNPAWFRDSPASEDPLRKTTDSARRITRGCFEAFADVVIGKRGNKRKNLKELGGNPSFQTQQPSQSLASYHVLESRGRLVT